MAEETPDVGVRRGKVLKWLSLAARVILGAAIMIAGLLKVGDLHQAVVAVRAYQLPIPAELETWIGYGQPIVEILLGVLILAGLFTRWTGLLGAVLMLVFIAGIISVWVRGLSIDCGCFSDGGLLLPGQRTKYFEDIMRDVGLVVCGVWLVIFPHSPISVDSWVAGTDTKEA
ncbi:MAG: DoxX family protein [Propionibacteriaceae bacterium]|nr:DoxX family protein [Propionibacteriaceae bacterium]